MNIAKPVTLITLFFASLVPALHAQNGSGTLRLLEQKQVGGSVSNATPGEDGAPAGAPVPEKDPLPWSRSDLVLRGRIPPGSTIEATISYKALSWWPLENTSKHIVGVIDEAQGTYRLHLPAVRDSLVMRDLEFCELKITVPDGAGGRRSFVKSLTSDTGLLASSVALVHATRLAIAPIGGRDTVQRTDREWVDREGFIFFYFERGRPGNHRLDIELAGPVLTVP